MKTKWVFGFSILSLATNMQSTWSIAQAESVNAKAVHWSFVGDEIKHISQAEAYDYCLDQNPESERQAIRETLNKNQIPVKGIYLPLARQLAEYAHSVGSRGIRETAHSGVPRSDGLIKTEISEMSTSRRTR